RASYPPYHGPRRTAGITVGRPSFLSRRDGDRDVVLRGRERALEIFSIGAVRVEGPVEVDLVLVGLVQLEGQVSSGPVALLAARQVTERDEDRGTDALARVIEPEVECLSRQLEFEVPDVAHDGLIVPVGSQV